MSGNILGPSEYCESWKQNKTKQNIMPDLELTEQWSRQPLFKESHK